MTARLLVPLVLAASAIFAGLAFAASYVGDDGPNHKVGGAGDDTFTMLGGQDLAEGQNGADYLGMGDGKDAAEADDGWDEIDGKDGADTVSNFGSNGLRGNEGDDSVDGGEGDDYVIGGVDDDRLKGNNGTADIIDGGDSNAFRDEITGGAGTVDSCTYSTYDQSGFMTRDYNFDGCELFDYVVSTPPN